MCASGPGRAAADVLGRLARHGEKGFIVPLAGLQAVQDAGLEVIVADCEDDFDLIDPASRSWVATLEVIKDYVGLTSRG